MYNRTCTIKGQLKRYTDSDYFVVGMAYRTVYKSVQFYS